MAGNKIGGLKASAKNKALYGKDWYQKIGQLGGKNGKGSVKGFAVNKELARIAGKLGGSRSRRRPKNSIDK